MGAGMWALMGMTIHPGLPGQPRQTPEVWLPPVVSGLKRKPVVALPGMELTLWPNYVDHSFSQNLKICRQYQNLTILKLDDFNLDSAWSQIATAEF